MAYRVRSMYIGAQEIDVSGTDIDLDGNVVGFIKPRNIIIDGAKHISLSLRKRRIKQFAGLQQASGHKMAAPALLDSPSGAL